jgi:SAM-dependent methyltransferase
MSTVDWIKFWNSEEYQLSKQQNFDLIEEKIEGNRSKILDIGCGLAFESELFQKKHGSELYLMDSNKANNKSDSRETKYDSINNFAFYNDLEKLEKSYQERDIRYIWVDANDPKIDNSVKFDLIYSFLSCGFHYPATAYKDLILAHSHEKTNVILDIRREYLPEHFKFLDVLCELEVNTKYTKASIKFK